MTEGLKGPLCVYFTEDASALIGSYSPETPKKAFTWKVDSTGLSCVNYGKNTETSVSKWISDSNGLPLCRMFVCGLGEKLPDALKGTDCEVMTAAVGPFTGLDQLLQGLCTHDNLVHVLTGFEVADLDMSAKEQEFWDAYRVGFADWIAKTERGRCFTRYPAVSAAGPCRKV